MKDKEVVKKEDKIYSVTVPMLEEMEAFSILEIFGNVLRIFEIEFENIENWETMTCEYLFIKKGE